MPPPEFLAHRPPLTRAARLLWSLGWGSRPSLLLGGPLGGALLPVAALLGSVCAFAAAPPSLFALALGALSLRGVVVAPSVRALGATSWGVRRAFALLVLLLLCAYQLPWVPEVCRWPAPEITRDDPILPEMTRD